MYRISVRIALVVLALTAFLFIKEVATAAPKKSVQYKVVPSSRDNRQAILDQYASEGWELVVLDATGKESMIFKR
jgi:hypothetical protein